MIKEEIENIDQMISAFDVKADTKKETYYSYEAVFDILSKIKSIGYSFTMGVNNHVYWCSIYSLQDKRDKTPSALYESDDSALDAIYLTIGFFLAKKNREVENFVSVR